MDLILGLEKQLIYRAFQKAVDIEKIVSETVNARDELEIALVLELSENIPKRASKGFGEYTLKHTIEPKIDESIEHFDNLNFSVIKIDILNKLFKNTPFIVYQHNIRKYCLLDEEYDCDCDGDVEGLYRFTNITITWPTYDAKKINNDEECCICKDSFKTGQRLHYCKQCKIIIHTDCYKLTKNHKCPHCRSPNVYNFQEEFYESYKESLV